VLSLVLAKLTVALRFYLAIKLIVAKLLVVVLR